MKAKAGPANKTLRAPVGVKNPHGDGYGYLSMRYVKEYGNAYVSELPKVTL